MRSRVFFLLTVLSAAALAQQVPQARPRLPRQNAPLSAPDRLLVQHRLGAGTREIQRAIAMQGARVDRYQDSLRLSVLHVDATRREQIQNELEQSGLFNFVEPDYYAEVLTVPNDPDYSSQWHLPAIQAPSAWNLTVGSTSVTVAMIDSGVDSTHPDLAGKVLPGWNFVSGNSNTSDTMGHGTTTAGVVGAMTDNNVGVAGIAWRNPIMPLVVVDSTGSASYSNIASAITYAANAGVRIVNISIGGTSASSALQSAVNYAWSKGTVVFASAGNGGVNAPYYPAGCQYVVAVGATDSGNNLASFSNYGAFLGVVAPGVNIVTTSEGGGYISASGTSYSSPIVAAVGALVLSYAPSLSASALVSDIEHSAADLGTAGFDSTFGWGLVNAYAAVSSASANIDLTAPKVTISSPAAGSTVNGTVTVQGTATDNVAISNIQFYVDGTLSGSALTSPYAFSWNTAAASNASHTLTVQATDPSNNVAKASMTVTVSNVTSGAPVAGPAVYIQNPKNNANVNGNLSVSTVATDSAGISQVCVYVDGVLQYTGSVSPYSFTLNTKKLSKGSHSIVARAWDPLGLVSTSTPVSFTYR